MIWWCANGTVQRGTHISSPSLEGEIDENAPRCPFQVEVAIVPFHSDVPVADWQTRMQKASTFQMRMWTRGKS